MGAKSCSCSKSNHGIWMYMGISCKLVFTIYHINHGDISRYLNANVHILPHLPLKKFRAGLPGYLWFPHLACHKTHRFPLSQKTLQQVIKSDAICLILSYYRLVFATLLFCSQPKKRAHIPSINNSVLILFLIEKVIRVLQRHISQEVIPRSSPHIRDYAFLLLLELALLYNFFKDSF